MHRLFAQPIVSFALGWVVACALHPASPSARAVALLGVLALGAWRVRRSRLPAGGVIALGFLACTAVAGVDDSAARDFPGRTPTDVLMQGTIIDGPRHGPRGAGYEVRVDVIDEERVSAQTLRVWSPERDDVRAGDVVELFARCRRLAPREFPDLPGAETRGMRRGIDGRCTALEPFVRLDRPSTLSGALAARRLAVERLLSAMDSPASGIAIAMLTGTRGFVSDRARTAFRDTGTGHLLAISGLHFGMLAALCWMLAGLVLRRSMHVARRFGVRRASAIAVVTAMAGYLLLVGAPTSASRAWIVIAFAGAGLLLFRRPSGFAALSAAAVLLTVTRPGMVFDLGFQLSFCATGAIVLFWWRRPRLVDVDPYAFDSRKPAWLRRLGAFVLMSWCATAVTWPLLLGATGRISLVAVVANPIAVPWIGGVVFPILLAAVALVTLAPVTAPVLVVPETLLELTVVVLEQLAMVPHATWCPGVPHPMLVAAALIAVLAVIASRMRPRALLTGGVVLATCAALANRPPPPSLRVHFIPVGQGDATLVEFPGGRRVLIDAGGSRWGRDPGRYVVVPYLRRRGIERLDALLVTHDDVDHSGGVPGVLAEIDVDRVVREPRSLGEPGTTVERLVATGSSNDRSLVTTIRQLGTTTLLTGDIERAAEASWVRAPQRVTVLKVPHHGSATSSTPRFLERARPTIAVVSAGRHNRFGHPHPTVVRRYRARATRLFSTARHGLVLVDVNPRGVMTVRTVR